MDTTNTRNGLNLEQMQQTVMALQDDPQLALFEFRTSNQWISGGDEVTFTGVDGAAHFRIWIGPTDDDLVAYREDVPGDSGEVVLPLVPGQVMRGSIKLPEPEQVSQVWVMAGIGDAEAPPGGGAEID